MSRAAGFLLRSSLRYVTRNADPRPLDGIKVLVVEDDAQIRTAIRRYLEGAGCTVLTAELPSEGVSLARAAPGTLDLALIDLILPEMSGPECADALREHQPSLPIAYMSGYAEAVSEGFPEDDTPVLLQKPFARDELIVTILALLKGERPSA